jgi:hypothetical protein
MPDWEKASFVQAFKAFASGMTPADLEGGAPEGGPRMIQIRRERINKRNEIIQRLQDLSNTMDKNDPRNKEIAYLIAEGTPGDMVMPGGVLVSEEKLNDWVNRAEQILRPSILEQRRGGTNVPEQRPLPQRALEFFERFRNK